MGCATGVVKYFVFFANLVFALAGAALVIIGVVYKVNYGAATNALPTDFGLAPVLSIIIGCIVFVTAFLGCCGAVKESPCMLTTYSIILLVIFLVQVAIGIYAFIKIKDESQFRDTIRKALHEPFSKYYKNPEATETTDVIQRLLSCCGVENVDQWENNTLPISCCPSRHSSSPCLKSEGHYFKKSCTDSLYYLVMNNAIVIGGTVIGVCIIELLGAVLGFCLSSSINNHYRRSLYA